MEKIKIGVVGLRFGLTVIENLMASDDTDYIELHGVFDLDREKVVRVSSQYRIKAYNSLDDMLAESEIQAVALYTPPTGRSSLIEQIMKSGKHVITTKPLEVDWRKTESILKKSQQMNKVIHINSPDVVDNGMIRAVKEAVSKFDLGRPIGARCDVWVNYNEKADGSWYDNPDQCPVAPIFRLGIYIINDLIALYGKTKALSTFSSRLVTQRPTVDNSVLSLSFENGVVASVFGSFCVDDGQRYKGPVILNYERGTFYYGVFPNGELEQKDLILVHKDQDGAAITDKLPIVGSPKGVYLWKQFYQDILENRTATDEYIERVTEGIRVLQGMRMADEEKKVVFSKDV